MLFCVTKFLCTTSQKIQIKSDFQTGFLTYRITNLFHVLIISHTIVASGVARVSESGGGGHINIFKLKSLQAMFICRFCSNRLSASPEISNRFCTNPTTDPSKDMGSGSPVITPLIVTYTVH